MKIAILLTALTLGITTEAAMALDLTVTRTIDAPADEVWTALTEADSIRQWWGPTGFTAPVVRTDIRVGGVSVVCMTAPGFPLMCNSWAYTAVEPGRKLAFDSSWVDEQGAAIDPTAIGLPADLPDVVPHVVELVPLAEGKTELRWTEFGYASEATAQLSRGGLEQVLDKLVASLQ